VKLVSNQYMRALNYHFERLGRAPMRKRTFMAMMRILTRNQQRDILRQFDNRPA